MPRGRIRFCNNVSNVERTFLFRAQGRYETIATDPWRYTSREREESRDLGDFGSSGQARGTWTGTNSMTFKQPDCDWNGKNEECRPRVARIYLLLKGIERRATHQHYNRHTLIYLEINK